MFSPRRRRSPALVLVAAALIAACSSGSDAETTASSGATAQQSTVSAPAIADAVVASTAPPTTTGTAEIDEPDSTTPATTRPPSPATTAPESAETGDPDTSSLVWATHRPDQGSGVAPSTAFDFGSYAVISQSAEHLVATTALGATAPALAVEWFPNADATEWTFILRDDVRFHDGKALSADDVVWSLDLAIDSGAIGVITSVSAVDERTVSVTTTDSAIELPYLVSDAAPQTAIVRNGDDGFGATLVGTGPFVMTDYDELDRASFVANDDWWNGAPSIDRLDLVFFDSGGRAATALRAGEVDGVAQIDSFDREVLLADPGIDVTTIPSSNHRQIWMRTDEGPFADLRVRQAFALSLDRQAIVDRIFAGDARPAADHPFSISTPGFDPTISQRSKDDIAARALLADAGFPDGIELTLFVGDIAEIPDLAAVIAEQAASAGFTISVDVQNNSTFYGNAWCPRFDSDRCDGESFGIVDYGHRVIPHVLLENSFTTSGVWNSSNHADPVYDEFFARFAGAPDAAAQAAAASDIQRYLDEQLPVVIPYFFDPSFAHRSDVGGVTVTALGQPRLDVATIG